MTDRAFRIAFVGPILSVQRVLEPELLDSLPPHHPDALHNRRDLRLTNQIAGTHRWLVRVMPKLLRPGELALEIGAGQGDLGFKLLARGLNVDALDLWPRPSHWPATRSWHVADARTFDRYAGYAGVLGNLIFHQFRDDELRLIGERLRATARVIVACEPARRRISQKLFRWLGPLLGANYVTLHDAHVSIAAGFRDDELPRVLGLGPPDWRVHCSISLIGAYRMVAVRNDSVTHPRPAPDAIAALQ